jgi:CBS-domain-containing membrane protein
MQAKDVMSDGVLSVNAGASLLEAARLLVNAGVSAMPVIDDTGVMVGILSEADLIRGIAAQADPGKAIAEAKARHVADIMTKDVVTAGEDTDLSDIAGLMLSRNIKRVPILRDRSVVGVVSRVDLLQALVSVGAGMYVPKAAAARTADDNLRPAVMAALQRQNWAHVGRSDVVISHGVVHLWGVVASDAVRSGYVEAVRKVPGVTSVENHMHVGRPHVGTSRF